MKTVILFLLLVSANFAQSSLTLLMDNGTNFNPLTYDANTVMLFDGDLELTTEAWGDQSTNGYDLALTNAPTIVSNAINGHQSVRFDGVSEFGRRITTPSLTQPHTYYIVFKQITHTGEVIFSASSGANRPILYQGGTSPNLAIHSGAELSSDPDLALNTYGIITCVLNGANSEIRTNSNAAVIGNAGVTSGTGFVIAANYSGTSAFTNCEIAYILVRSGADSTLTQNIFIAFLKNRFGL